MFDKALEALLHYLENNPIIVGDALDILFLRAKSFPQRAIFAQKNLICHQTFKRDADLLQKAGFKVSDKIEGQFDLCLFLGTKQRDENLAQFARGILALRDGGLFLCALPNELGAARFEKELAALGELEATYAKHHCRVFGIRRTPQQLQSETLKDWEERGRLRIVPGTKLYSQPGVFGWDKIDKGSELLCEHLPASLDGIIADLGCGYGFISAHLLQTASHIRELHLYEAEKLALDAAAFSFDSWQERAKLHFHWHDVAAGLPAGKFDAVVMNPPFHTGRQTSTSLGQSFVQAAATALRRNGVLYMVANLHLPYEKVLAQHFSSHEQMAARLGFKVLRAVK